MSSTSETGGSRILVPYSHTEQKMVTNTELIHQLMSILKYSTAVPVVAVVTPTLHKLIMSVDHQHA